MALASDYNALCPLFDFGNSGGVVFPFVIPAADYTTRVTWGGAIDLDGGDTSSIMCRFRPIMDLRVISCQIMSAEDADGNTKGGTASIEPVITFGYGTAPLASGEESTTINAVTCIATGDAGTVWGPGTSTTPVTISSTQEIVVYLTTAAAEGSWPSSRGHGAGIPIVWFAHVNAPA